MSRPFKVYVRHGYHGRRFLASYATLREAFRAVDSDRFDIRSATYVVEDTTSGVERKRARNLQRKKV